MSNPKIIEFVGLPGSGKSTICNILSENVSSDIRVNLILGIEYKNRYSYLFKNNLRSIVNIILLINSYFNNPKLVYETVVYGFKNGISLKRISQIGWFINNIEKLKSISNTHDNNISIDIYDQGVVQMIGSMAIPNTRNSININKLLNISVADIIDGIIWVDIPKDLALQRLRDRIGGRSRFNKWDDCKALKNMDIMEVVLKDVISFFNYNNVPVLKISGVTSPVDNARVINLWLHTNQK